MNVWSWNNSGSIENLRTHPPLNPTNTYRLSDPKIRVLDEALVGWTWWIVKSHKVMNFWQLMAMGKRTLVTFLLGILLVYLCFVSCKLFEMALLLWWFFTSTMFGCFWCFLILVVWRLWWCVCFVTMFLVGCELWRNGDIWCKGGDSEKMEKRIIAKFFF